MNCTTCGNLIEKRDGNKVRRNRHHFCSVPCYQIWWTQNIAKRGPMNQKWTGGPVTKTCKQCGSPYSVHKSIAPRSNFCSHACRAKFVFTGIKNVNWKGGVSLANYAERHSSAYIEWRTAVYRRDGWTCQMCGYHGKRLIAHHLQKFSDHPELRYVVENGQTLCRPCHSTVENPHRAYAGHVLGVVKMCAGLHGDMQRLTETMSPAAACCL